MGWYAMALVDTQTLGGCRFFDPAHSSMPFAMFWEIIFWALALGFFISGIVQAVGESIECLTL